MKSRTILVTGGNRGIGLATVKKLAQNPEDKVLLGCRSLASGEEEAKKIGKNVHAIELELSTREKLALNVDKIKQKYEKVDVLINNAGILNEGHFLDIPYKRLEESFRVNTLAPYELMRAFVPSMIDNSYGRVVNVSSGWGSFDEGLEGPFAYSFSKSSLNALTLTLSKDLSENVKVNSMCPGWVRTRMGGMSAPRSPEEAAETAVWLSNLDENGPSGKFFRDKKPINW